MAPGALKKTRAQQANDADKPRPSVRFAETKKEKAAVAAEEAERREELEDALLDDPYFNSLDPGYWQHFRAWCIFFFRYFAFLAHLFADWLWRTIPWVVCGLWDACTSRNGRRWIVGVVVLRAAIFCRDVGCKSRQPSLPTPCGVVPAWPCPSSMLTSTAYPQIRASSPPPFAL